MIQDTKKRAEPSVPTFRPDGTVMDLANVTAADIDFAAMAEGLSKIARFNGIHRGPAYSVAQHSVMGADALFRETGDALLAGCFVLHDGREYVIGDWTRPSIDALDYWLVKLHKGHGAPPPMRMAVKHAAELAGIHIDAAIYAAAGLPAYPATMPEYARLVRDMDDRMLRAEGLALFGPNAAQHLPAPDRPAPRITGAIHPWGAMRAEEAFLDRLYRYLNIQARAV